MSLRLTFLALISLTACSAPARRASPPIVALPGIGYSTEKLKATDLTCRPDSGPFRVPAGTPTTILTVNESNLSGYIRVRKTKDGKSDEFVPSAIDKGAYLDERREKKHYRWGHAQSCLAQFTNENLALAPNNDCLEYQVAGLTADGRFSVFCGFSVTHPKLPTIAHAKGYRGDQLHRLRYHPDVKLIQNAPSNEFRPSIDRIDEVINSLEIHE